MSAVGKDKSSAGSKLLIQAIDNDDDRSLWVTVWGGPNTLAQALSDLRATRSAEAMQRALAKVRVYTISTIAAWQLHGQPNKNASLRTPAC
jgi:hypothetical protein